MKNNWKEELWKKFEENRFIQSTDSVTDEIQEIDGYVTDMEAIIKIKGEFDKYGVESFVKSILEEQKKELMIEVMEQEVKCLQEIYNNRNWNELVDQYNLIP